MLRQYLVTAAAICLIPFSVYAQEAPAIAAPAAIPVPAADAPVTHSEFPALMKQTLLDNPEILLETFKKYQQKQMDQTKADIKESLEKNKSTLFSDTESPSTGDPKIADLTIVEFFDYHCGYCKRLYPTLAKLAHEDKKLRIIFREFPILSEESVMASRAALSVYRLAPQKYLAYHGDLMQANGQFDEKFLTELAVKHGIAAAAFKTEIQKGEITDVINKNRDLGDSLGVRGTPALVIGDDIIPGAVPYEDLKKAIAEARAKAANPAKN